MKRPVFETIASALAWLAEHKVLSLTQDSRHVKAGDAFIACLGHQTDGRKYVTQAFHAGAIACLAEYEGAVDNTWPSHLPIALVPQLSGQLGVLAHTFWGKPSHQLDVMAVTGTNGKTSTSWWLSQAMSALGRPCAVAGTLGLGQPPQLSVPSHLTTPDPLTLHLVMNSWVKQGITACALEASSIGLSEQRLNHTRITTALFTNFTQDHLDYHQDMASYWAAKAKLFSWPGLHSVVINVEDPKGLELVSLVSSPVDIWTYAYFPTPARLQARIIEAQAKQGLAFEVIEDNGDCAQIQCSILGDYNIANLLAVVAALRARDFSLAEATNVCRSLSPVPGRMQWVAKSKEHLGPVVIVDYAHTPDALAKALSALRPMTQARKGQLWVVFGCGGNRDTSKRPQMGAQAQSFADHVVVTSDNPRLEKPSQIIEQVLKGLQSPVTVIEDRQQAIIYSIEQAQPQDVILLAGKGHEMYQDVAGIKYPFSDVTQAQQALVRREIIQ